MHMPVHPSLGCRHVIGSDIAGIALGQIESKEVDLLLHAAQNNNGIAKVSLAVSRWMRQRNEHLTRLLTLGPYLVLYLSYEPFLLAEPGINLWRCFFGTSRSVSSHASIVSVNTSSFSRRTAC